MSEPVGWFRTTMWTVVERARAGDRTAFDDLVREYLLPVTKYLQHHGFDGHDAEDLAQDIFLRIYEKGVLTRVEASRGRFRSLLMAVSLNVAKESLRNRHAQKRGGDRPSLSLDHAMAEDVETTFAQALTAPEDDDFNRLWTWNLLGLAFRKLREECDERRTPHYRLLHRFMEHGPGAKTEDLAQEFSLKPAEVTTRIHEARRALKRHVTEAIRDYTLTSSEFEEECRVLRPYLE